MARETDHRRYPSVKAGLYGGALAGLIAGIVMAMVAMIRNAVVGLGFWLPPKLIGGLVYGVDALIVGSSAIVVGLLIHMVFSMMVGAPFGATVGRRSSTGGAFGWGLVYGAAIWAVMTWAVLPWANQMMLDRVMVAPWWWFGYHLVFGAMLALTPALVASFAEQPRETRAAEDGTAGEEREERQQRRMREREHTS